MLKNYLAAALRNLARNRLHSAITTVSLALGFTAVILATLYWRYEHTYDRFWPQWERTWMAMQLTHVQGRPPFQQDTAPASQAQAIRADIPGVEAVARLIWDDMTLTRGEVEAKETGSAFVDANFFDLLRPTVLTGTVAPLPPGSIVLTRSGAQKYFGRTDIVGETITLTEDEEEPLTFTAQVAAVIEDLPPNTHLPATVFMSLHPAAELDDPATRAVTYFRVRPGVRQAALDDAFRSFTERRMPATISVMSSKGRPDVRPIPLRQAYMRDLGYGMAGGATWSSSTLRTGSPMSVILLFGLSGLILVVAAINFITLMTARGARRAVEVGIRKAAGARRRDLVLQFVGESVLYSALALAIALALTELCLPYVAKALDLTLSFDYVGDPILAGVVLGGALAIGLAAGLYPAFALSAFKPARVLKGGLAKTPGSGLLRQILLSLQFTPLIILAVGGVAFDMQMRQAEKNSLKMGPDNALIVTFDCKPPIAAAVAALSGVRQASCIDRAGNRSTPLGSAQLTGGPSTARVKTPGAQDFSVGAGLADADTFRYWDLSRIAGRLWSSPDDQGVVVNETGARRLGFARTSDAVGKGLDFRRGPDAPATTRTIIGVINDRGGIAGFEEGVWFQDPAAKRPMILGVRLADPEDKATLAAIDATLIAQGVAQPIDRALYRDIVVEENYDGFRRGIAMFGAYLALALLIACAGLFGLAAFLAEQRTKEIGVRKALGANRVRLMRMLVFQFARPVLIANLIACPLVFVASSLLQQPIPAHERIALGLPQFLPVIIGSMLLAFAATFAHAWQVTGARPVTALRYE